VLKKVVCREKGIIFHSDAAQATGRVAFDLSAMPVDLMSLTAHKTYGPKGVGALFVRRKPRVRLEAQMHGGGHERKMAMLLALARAKVEDEHAAALVRTASRQSVISRLASISSNAGDSDPARESLPTIPSAVWPSAHPAGGSLQPRHVAPSAFPSII